MRGCRILLILLTIVPAPLRAADDDAERQALLDVQSLLQTDRMSEAEQELTKHLKEFPDSARVNSLRMNFAYAYRRAKNHTDAFRHMQQLVGYYSRITETQPEYYKQLSNAMTAMGSYSRVAGEEELAEKQFAGTLKLLNARTESQSSEAAQSAGSAIHSIRLRLIEFLIDIEKYEEAESQLVAELALAKSEYEAKSDSPQFILNLANALQARVTLRDRLGRDGLEDARDRQLTFLKLKAEAHPDNPEIVGAFLEGHLQATTDLASIDPVLAEEILNRIAAFAKTLEDPAREVEQKILVALRTFPYLRQTIDTGKRHAELISESATPFEDTTSWVGEADNSFDGNVIVLDFWAVWCGPCLESIPHLNRWQKQYANRGLKVIGVTKFYNYAWDSQNARPIRGEKSVAQSDELEMVANFADWQKMEYPLAVTLPGSDFQKKYGVVGIPQTVLIDRQGKIRLIRVGTGAAAVREMERELKKLLAEPAATSE